MNIAGRALRALMSASIVVYQHYISPTFGPRCQYAPSCPAYTPQATHVRGPIKGLILEAWRLLRCNPWSHGGVDRVPKRGRRKPDPWVPPEDWAGYSNWMRPDPMGLDPEHDLTEPGTASGLWGTTKRRRSHTTAGAKTMFDAILHSFVWAISYMRIWTHDLLMLLRVPSGSSMTRVLSIVLLIILVRVATIPLFLKQIRSSRVMQVAQPKMHKIQEKYKDEKDQVSRRKMMEETRAPQCEHKASPFASRLPMLVQMPALFDMYRAIIAASSTSNNTYAYRGEATGHLGPLVESVSTEIMNSTVLGVPLSHTLRKF